MSCLPFLDNLSGEVAGIFCQALVQFSDAETASSAKNALDGGCIPRAYTNPYLPVAQSAIDGSGQLAVGVNGKKLQPESNVLLALIENMQYAVMLDVLHMKVDYSWNFPADIQTAVVAKESFEGHCIYNGRFCKLHLSYSRHTDLSIKVNNDWSRDYTLQNPAMANTQPSIFGQQPGPATSQYGGPGQYPPVPGQTMMQQPTAGWGPAPGSP
ncbi:hypothetical protein CRG98_029534 [Punica granatum]|uniref:Uncharacterized protein n=1 Tax=Punica granatum TaxID=22663 RepID=A0A2I0J314_PUNGR|nr:hypothetical protein CRG98_029534 [Punica granatum]